jgi:hypothetical protein
MHSGTWILSRNILPILWFVHYSKRVLEVLTLHSYSGPMDFTALLFLLVKTAIDVLGSCFYAKRQVIDYMSLNLGLFLFVAGEIGNAVHHQILVNARIKNPGKEYPVVHAGFFSILIMPHYTFELLALLGIGFISNYEPFAISCIIYSFCFMAGRAIGTRTWYRNFVPEWKSLDSGRYYLIPYLF